jgi:Uma2 family endonuclease
LAKADFYLRNGGRMVWLIYPEQRIVEVLTQQDRQLLTENSTLTGGDVLPEFSIPVSRIFRRL